MEGFSHDGHRLRERREGGTGRLVSQLKRTSTLPSPSIETSAAASGGTSTPSVSAATMTKWLTINPPAHRLPS